MLYVVTLQSGAKVLVPARSPDHAVSKVEKRVATRVVEVGNLEAMIYSDMGGMAYLNEVPSTGESP